MGDAAGLFGARDRSRSRSPRRAPAAGASERRVKLYPKDTVAAQFLNPYGSNAFSQVPEFSLWAAVTKGHKTLMYHSELAADAGDEWRNSVGLSRAAESIESAIMSLKDANIKLLIKEAHYAKAIKEADDLLPHLKVLNAGKGSEGTGDFVGNLKSLRKKKQDAGARQVTPGAAVASAKDFHKWLTADESALRGMLMVLAGDGCF